MVRILMVCMGNICRSPMAEAVLRAMAAESGLGAMVQIDSAGTHGYHVGEPPDERARQVGAQRGYDLGAMRARKIAAEDFSRFDLILAMDRRNLSALQAMCPQEQRQKLRLFLEFAEHAGNDEVPDPYYGNLAGFERVLDLCETAARGVISEIKREVAKFQAG